MDTRAALPPIPDQHRRWLVVGLLLAVAFRLVLAYLNSNFPFEWGMGWILDTKAAYKPLARNLLAGHGFSLDTAPPHGPSIFRGPVYPLFLAGIYGLTSFSDNAVILVQLLLSAGSCLVFYGLAREVFANHPARDAIALAAFFFLAINPFTNALNSYLLTETLSQTLLLLALYWMVLAVNSGRSSQAFASGIFSALSFLNHPALAAVTAVLGLWLLGSVVKRHASHRHFIGFALGVFILWAPWAVRNYANFDRFIPLTVSSGAHFYLNVMHLEDDPDQARACLGAIKMEANQISFGGMLPDGQEGLDADARCYRSAWRIIRAHPWAFARHTLKKPARMWLSSYSSIIFPISDHFGTRLIFWDRALIAKIAKVYSVSQLYVWFLVGAKLFLRLLNPFFILTGLFGLIKIWQNGVTQAQWPVLLALGGYTVGFMFMSPPSVVYMIVVWPCLILLSAYGCLTLWYAMARH